MYTVKHFVHHINQLRSIQATRGNVPAETVSHIKSLSRGSAEVASYLGLDVTDFTDSQMDAAIDAHLEQWRVQPVKWRRE